eukprot:m.268424 g.268424  ORF g.268424 m.268424 type:complete len:66 (+) comp11077_c2_seq2:115-312(+)
MATRMLYPPKDQAVTILNFCNWLRLHPDELNSMGGGVINKHLSNPDAFADLGLKLLARSPTGKCR